MTTMGKVVTSNNNDLQIYPLDHQNLYTYNPIYSIENKEGTGNWEN